MARGTGMAVTRRRRRVEDAPVLAFPVSEYYRGLLTGERLLPAGENPTYTGYVAAASKQSPL